MAGELLELMMDGDKELLGKVTRRIMRVIEGSFADDKSRPTRSEVRRRFVILETLLRELRSEHGWGMERILDTLPLALRSRLDGIPWDPSEQRKMWVPQDGAVIG